MSKDYLDPACDGRRCPGRAGGAGVPWHVLLSQIDGPIARPPRHALYGQRLEAPTKRGARDGDGDHGRAARVNDGRDHGRAPRVADHGRSRRRTRSAAAGYELQWRLVCLRAPPLLPPVLRNLAAAFLSAAEATTWRPAAAATAAAIFFIPHAIATATTAAEATSHALNRMGPDIHLAPPAVPPALLARTAPQARHSWPACLGRAAKQPTPAHRAAAAAPEAVAPPRAITHQPTVHTRAQVWG